MLPLLVLVLVFVLTKQWFSESRLILALAVNIPNWNRLLCKGLRPEHMIQGSKRPSLGSCYTGSMEWGEWVELERGWRRGSTMEICNLHEFHFRSKGG